MRKHIYILTALAIIVSVYTMACKSNTMSNFSEETGLIDEATGKVWTNGFVKTDTVTATEETIRGYTNVGAVKEIITQYVQGEKEYIIKYVTNETVAQLPDKPGAKYRISVPFASRDKVDVDYRDTARLKQLWLDQINRTAFNDGRVMAIRNGANNRDINNFQKPHTDAGVTLEDYFYFDSKGDIYYKPDNRLIKKFVGAVIVDYVNVTKKNYGYADSVTHEYAHTGEYTVAGIYKMAISGLEADSLYRNDKSSRCERRVYTFIEADITLSKFWNGAYYENIYFKRQFERDYIEFLVMNPYGNEGLAHCAGVDSYYVYYGGGFGHPDRTEQNVHKMMDEKLYLGERPEFVVPQFTRYVSFSDSGDSPWWSFMFMPGHKN